MHSRTVVWTLVLTSWILIATVGDHLDERPFVVALGALMVWTTYAALRGQAWLEAVRIGRQIERQQTEDREASTTVDLKLYRGEGRGRAS